MRKKCLQTIYDVAKKNDKVIFIGSDLGPGILENMKNEMPERFFMEGISEQHIIGMAAGLAFDGFLPFVNTISTFLTRRCFEQIILDLCLHDLPVKLVGNGGGLVYAPLGPTHQAIDDIAILRSIPNMTIVAPCDAVEMEMLIKASIYWPHPIYIRIAKGGDSIITKKNQLFQIGKSILIKEPGETLIISTGIMTQVAIECSNLLKNQGLDIGVLHMHTIKPLDFETLNQIIPKVKKIITIEEHFKNGGLGSAILEYCNEYMPEQCYKIKRLGLPDKFVGNYGSQIELLNSFNLNTDSLIAIIKDF
ncbi:transketolase [Alphaproteobacteria bacterium]|nr:transketolase [Alphaproteobacteria bacterium]